MIGANFEFGSGEQAFHALKAAMAGNKTQLELIKDALKSEDSGASMERQENIRNLTSRTNLPMTPEHAKGWDSEDALHGLYRSC